jgi:hypothetical protein
MMNRNERMEKLNNAGVNTGKYFNFNLPDGLKPGATISLVINENGEPVVIGGDNAVREQIISDGYVRNTKLHRRFVMAQMFHMLNYVSYNGKERGYSACLRNSFDYKYSLDMMIEEVRVLSKLEKRDQESFAERRHFFTVAVVINVLTDYLDKLQKYVETLPNKNCKGVPYKRVKGIDIFVADLDKKLYRPISHRINRMKVVRSYEELHRELRAFMRYSFVKLPYNTPKSRVWVDAYKGEGAYYTLKNLSMCHDCKIMDKGYGFFTTAASMDVLKSKLDEYHGEGWRMFALMKKVIKDNNFDFNKRMEDLGVK